jgi:hypothetical protein
MKTVAANTILAVALIACPATAHADDPVPTVDQVMAIVNELIDPDIPAASKGNIVTPGFTPDEAHEIDDHLHEMDARRYPPMNIVVSNIQPAQNNYAGATLAAYNGVKSTPPGPIVLVDQNGRWLITHDAAMNALDAFWRNSTRRPIHVGQVG